MKLVDSAIIFAISQIPDKDAHGPVVLGIIFMNMVYTRKK